MAALAIRTSDTREYRLGGAELPDFAGSPRLIRAADLESDPSHPGEAAGFTLAALRGRLVELASSRPSVGLSLTCPLLVAAQRQSAPAVWISATHDIFFPPDMAANGVDLAALPVVRVPEARSAGRAADWLLRTGAFGLLIIDLHRNSKLPTALQARLAQQAHRCGSAVLLLTVKPADFPSLGSMISLYARVLRSRIDFGRFRVSLQIIKDKKRAPVWEHEEHLYGPPGLC